MQWWVQQDYEKEALLGSRMGNWHLSNMPESPASQTIVGHGGPIQRYDTQDITTGGPEICEVLVDIIRTMIFYRETITSYMHDELLYIIRDI